MYINNNSSFLYSAQDDKPFVAQNKEVQVHTPDNISLENFSEKAKLTFESLSAGLSQQEKNEIAATLNNIGKAASFASMNGFESQSERIIVNQYFESFGGVLSDDAIKKMIFSKLDNPNYKHKDFLEGFAKALGEPLKSINVRV